jgi:restriction system protein
LLENFLSTQLEELVSEILVAHGYVCSGTRRSGDAGIDIIAGRGTLGLDSPRIVAQCKSEKSQVGIDVVTRLRGTIQSAGAEQGLLVAYAGITRQAQTELEKNLFSVKVWDADDVVDELFSVYGKLSSEMRSRIPLKQVWTLVPKAE